MEEKNLLFLLPKIKRCRDYRLYAENGKRYLDLYLEDERGILGAKGKNLGRQAKALIDIGGTRPLMSKWRNRLLKHILKKYTLYEDLRILNKANFEKKFHSINFFDPAILTDKIVTHQHILLRPFNQNLKFGIEAEKHSSIAKLVLPCSDFFSPIILLFKSKKDAENYNSDMVEPILEALSLSALQEFEGFKKNYNEKHWSGTDKRLKKYFRRNGPYLYPLCSRDSYSDFFISAIESGILLSPSYEKPSIIPGDFDDGELAKLNFDF